MTTTEPDLLSGTDQTGSSVERPPRGRRHTWAFWGAAAGAAGFLGLMFDGSASLPEESYLKGSALVAELERGQYHVGLLFGLVAVFSLLVAAAGWRRWAQHDAPDDLAAQMVPYGMVAAAGAMILGYGFKGSMAIYLQGGIDEGTMTDEGLYSVFMFLDFAPYVAWWGVTASALAITWMSLRHGRIPRWIGIVGGILTLVPLVIVALTALPGICLLSTVWLVIISVGMGLSRRPIASR